MTTAISQTTLTLQEILARTGADGKLLPVVHTLMETNQLIAFALAWGGIARCNNNLTFKGTRDSTEPTPSEIDYDEGITATIGTAEPFEEPTCTLADMLKMDLNKLNDQSDGAAVMNDELRRHINGFNKTFASRLFYGDRDTYRKRIRGLEYRSAYNALSSARVFDNAGGAASATANKASIFILDIGPGGWQIIYPQNDTRPQNAGQDTADTKGLGIHIIDYGDRVPLTDGDGNPYPGTQAWMQMRWGQAVHNPDAVARIANISTTSIDEVDDFSLNEDYLIDALTYQTKKMGSSSTRVIVIPSAISGQLWKRVNDKGNLFHTMEDPFGRPVRAFNDVPIAVCDALTETEATVS